MLPIEIDELQRRALTLEHRQNSLEGRMAVLENAIAEMKHTVREHAQLIDQQGNVNDANLHSHEQILAVLDSIKNAFVALTQIGKH